MNFSACQSGDLCELGEGHRSLGVQLKRVSRGVKSKSLRSAHSSESSEGDSSLGSRIPKLSSPLKILVLGLNDIKCACRSVSTAMKFSPRT